MTLEFDKSFHKSLKKINDKKLFAKIEKIITDFERAETLEELSNIKKMVGFANYYRIRIGDYRIGIEVIENKINFIIITHRKDIYNKFP